MRNGLSRRQTVRRTSRTAGRTASQTGDGWWVLLRLMKFTRAEIQREGEGDELLLRMLRQQTAGLWSKSSELAHGAKKSVDWPLSARPHRVKAAAVATRGARCSSWRLLFFKFMSHIHMLHAVRIQKHCLSAFDDKRYPTVTGRLLTTARKFSAN